jgi:hypothetical protein
MKPTRYQQPPRKRRRSPDAEPSATQAHQDSLSLVRTLLDSWAWHPQCPLERTDESPPVEFGRGSTEPAAVMQHYREVFTPFIIDETVAQLQREADEEVAAKRVLPVHITRTLDLQQGKADVTCRVDPNAQLDDSWKKRLREGAIVLLCMNDPRTTMPCGITAALAAPPRGSAASGACASGGASTGTPVVIAAWLKHPGRTVRDAFVLEAQYGLNAPSHAAVPSSHPAAFAGPALFAALSSDRPPAAPPVTAPAAAQPAQQQRPQPPPGAQEPAKWYLIACSVPTTAQREMAALAQVARRPATAELAAPAALLARQGGVYHQIWPHQVRLRAAARLRRSLRVQCIVAFRVPERAPLTVFKTLSAVLGSVLGVAELVSAEWQLAACYWCLHGYELRRKSLPSRAILCKQQYCNLPAALSNTALEFLLALSRTASKRLQRTQIVLQ